MQTTSRCQARVAGRKAGPRRGRRRRWTTLWVVVLVGLTVALTTASRGAQRPPVSGRTSGVSAGHPLTSAAALETLSQGGNAFDAGVTARAIQANLEFFEAWPENQRHWLKPDGSLYAAGETIKLPTLAHTLTRMVEAEQAKAHLGRRPGCRRCP